MYHAIAEIGIVICVVLVGIPFVLPTVFDEDSNQDDSETMSAVYQEGVLRK